MLTPLLDRAVIPDLKKLIDYWKIHERIAHIRQGSINVLRHLQGQTTNEPSSPLNAAPDITQEPSGATCYEGYENYCINYSQRYSDDALKLIAQYSSSAELLAFVHSLNENEGDSLLEAANDFDETLTDTKTMVDFAVLKTFIDRAYANIKRAKRKTTATPLSLEDVIAAFQTLMNEPEFKNILECFEPCSKSLESIKRIHADSTNKGQSKRKRIFDIMADSSFTFIHESINVSGHVDDRFDVKSQKQSMRYDDLSELRDRARLIEYSNNKIKNETDREIEELHMFVILVDTIETILSILTSLYMAGHPWFETRAFIYRCFYSQTLQQLIRPELLSPLIQDRFVGLLTELFTSKPKRNFQMSIITTSQTGHWRLLNGLRTLQIVYSVHDQEMLGKEELENTIQKLLGNNDAWVTSQISGLGKSTYIRDEILRMNKHYIKFPIGGEMSADILAERLRNQGAQLASSTAALHIDIGTIENAQQLNELLYCLLLFRSFRFGQEAIYVPPDVPIYIELDASPHTSNLQERMDVSSVSLRDVARFCNLYNWFYRSILIRKGEQAFASNPSDVLWRASLMALLLCYYFRLRSSSQRRDYLNLIQNILKGVLTNAANSNFLIDLLRCEQLKLVDGMELPSGTAKNQALIDNIFVLLVCIVNRIPVILCGKPGCSKTSAIQIVISNLKGKRSEQLYCRTLPELIAVSYQGSQNCTSESIINVFQRAKKYLKAKSTTELLPVVVFDEIGLAELSPHNPLKVLHSELEVDACQHAFVGLSNWRLDASKMNRALYVACADPDISDLQNTATTIMSSMLDGKDQVIRLQDSILKGLATAYFDLYEQINTDQQYNNYFGLRDFYSLIKGVVRDLAETKEQDRYESIRRQLKINFDGIFDGAEFMWKRFCRHTTRQHLTTQYSSPTFKQLLDRSLTSRTGRYLMLIGENERAIDYVERYIIAKQQRSPVRTLIGSSLSGDLVSGTTYTEQYNYRLLMDIILHAETNVTLVMRQMGHLYESLYDLFNQSFAISARKKYCRIALGAFYHPRCLVHDDFYCVVFIRQQDVAKCDPPFLNRFEKHLIDINSLIHERHASLTRKFLAWLAELLPTEGNKHFPLLQHLFVDYSNEYTCNLVMDAFDHLNISVDDSDDHTDAVMAFLSGLRLPCAQYEYETIRCIRQAMGQHVQTEEIGLDQLNRSPVEQLRHRSAFGKNIETIFNDEILFNHYYHDQLALVQDETKIYQLSTTFIQSLLSTNSIRTVEERLNHLFTGYEELIELLRLFEIGVQVIVDENKFKFDQQFINLDKEEYPSNSNDSDFYCLVLTNGQFYLIPPRASMTMEEKFTCDGDPWIETSLMNLIELLVHQSVINSVKDIEQLTSVYGQIAQGILELSSYSVNNLEKLRSYTSLLRCITALSPSEQALETFKMACFIGKFDEAFTSCDTIHSFINYLEKIIAEYQPTISPTVIRQSLLKLEMEFLKNWLVDNSDQYNNILKLIGQSKDMWQYSAKIFFYIERKLKLPSIIENNHGRIPAIEDLAPLDQFLQETNDSTRKIERLIVNRLHMKLVLGASELETIEQVLTNDFEQLEKNIRLVQEEQSHSNLELICLISWLKYYAQLYAFALNHDSHNEIMLRLDRFFASDETSFCATLRLFIIKQLCQMFKVNLQGLRAIFINRNLVWIRSLISQSSNPDGMQHSLILPTPLFECRTEFDDVHGILINNGKIDQWKQLIVRCSGNQKLAYSFLIWFIHQYSHFYTVNALPDKRLIQVIEHDLSQELNECFTPIGYKFLISLCTNFNDDSYFQLQSTMNEDAVHRRLVALDIIALLISYKALGRNTYLGNLLFDSNLKIAENYTEYVQTKICLPAFLPNDPFITQMIDVRTQITARLPRISPRKRFIYQCSHDCPWIFYFENCGDPNDRRKCPMCNKDIGAAQDGVLIERDPPQLKISVDDGFQLIAKYIEAYNQKVCFGYHDRTSAEQSNTGEKPDHLQHSISYRFIHMFIHAMLLFLNELGYLPDFDLPKREHFQEHFEKDYALLAQQLNDAEECYLWLFKLFNHLINEEFIREGLLDNREKVVHLETFLEKQLIFPHLNSVTEEIRQYKLAYMDFLRQFNEKFSMERYVDEFQENDQQFPLLHYFNVTNIHTANPMNEFSSKLAILPYGTQTYPLTIFLLEKIDIYANIQHLYPIVAFTNHLIQKFDYRIKRNDALGKTISNYLNQGSDSEITLDLYEQFVDAWYKITMKEVQYRCQTAKLEHNIPQYEFAKNTKFAAVLLNTSKDESSILLAACLTTLGKLQNEIVNFFHHKIIGNEESSRRQRAIPIQSIRAEHVLKLTPNDISLKLITDGFTINYEYGMGKDIIYDYEEIELTLCNMVSRLPLINTEKLNYFNYQFELYGENSSLINDVRARVKQELLTDDERTKLQGYISEMSNEGILHYLGSLDYVFTYLATITAEFGEDP
ncbi:unnamed protein product, partial [Rotaria sp. Silwood1]